MRILKYKIELYSIGEHIVIHGGRKNSICYLNLLSIYSYQLLKFRILKNILISIKSSFIAHSCNTIFYVKMIVIYS